jgi:hypothetical protein
VSLFSPGFQSNLPGGILVSVPILAASLVIGSQSIEDIKNLPVQLLSPGHGPLLKGRAVRQGKASQELTSIESSDRFLPPGAGNAGIQATMAVLLAFG